MFSMMVRVPLSRVLYVRAEMSSTHLLRNDDILHVKQQWLAHVVKNNQLKKTRAVHSYLPPSFWSTVFSLL